MMKIIKIIRWVLSLFFLIVAFLYLKVNFLSFVILFALSLLLIPEIWNTTQKMIGRTIPVKFYALFLFILFMIGVSISPPLPSETKGLTSKPTVNPTSAIVSSTPFPTITEEEPITSLLPDYELVRESEEEGIYTAVIYSSDTSDYLIPNIISDLKKRKQKEKMSVMVFSKDNKSEVENAFETSDDASLSIIGKKIRAEYKKDAAEELYYYPDGLQGEKLALEIL